MTRWLFKNTSLRVLYTVDENRTDLVGHLAARLYRRCIKRVCRFFIAGSCVKL